MEPGEDLSSASRVIGVFADFCENMNEFSRRLSSQHQNRAVHTGADIRKYAQGWRLEKYIEMPIDDVAGKVAAWWVELGQEDDKWAVSSSVSVSNTDIYMDLPVLHASDAEELQDAFSEVIQLFTQIGEQENRFSAAI